MRQGRARGGARGTEPVLPSFFARADEDVASRIGGRDAVDRRARGRHPPPGAPEAALGLLRGHRPHALPHPDALPDLLRAPEPRPVHARRVPQPQHGHGLPPSGFHVTPTWVVSTRSVPRKEGRKEGRIHHLPRTLREMVARKSHVGWDVGRESEPGEVGRGSRSNPWRRSSSWTFW